MVFFYIVSSMFSIIINLITTNLFLTDFNFSSKHNKENDRS